MAADYVVVSSTDAAIARGQELVAGQRVPIKPGERVTILGASGDVLVLRGDKQGASVPQRGSDEAGIGRLAVLRIIVAGAPESRPVGFRTRAVCPEAERLVAVDDIVLARKAGCETQAATALDAYVANALKP
jgi:hypothetical protein